MRLFAYPLTLAMVLTLALATTAAAAYEEGQEECPPDMSCTTSAPDDDVQYSHNDAEPIPYGQEPYASGPGEDELTPSAQDDAAASIPGPAVLAAIAALAALAALALVGAFVRRT